MYDAGSHPALLGRTSDPDVLQHVRHVLLTEAEERFELCDLLDEPVLSASELAEFSRLRAVLDALVPETATEPT